MTTSPHRWVYSFSEPDRPGRDLLGGKGAELANLARLGLPVPPGFTITTEACRYFLSNGEAPEGMWAQVDAALATLELESGRSFGGGDVPLLVSVRSGASVSMPGMMDTVLNLGANDDVIASLAKSYGETFALDTHRRFVEMFTEVVLGVDIDLPQAARPIPADPREQMKMAIEAVFRSWNSRRAVHYRTNQGIPANLGTAVSVVAMVYGNADAESCSGVLFTRDPAIGERRVFGEYLPCSQGEDVVAGVATPQNLDAMADSMPDVHRRLMEVAERIESH